MPSSIYHTPIFSAEVKITPKAGERYSVQLFVLSQGRSMILYNAAFCRALGDKKLARSLSAKAGHYTRALHNLEKTK